MQGGADDGDRKSVCGAARLGPTPDAAGIWPARGHLHRVRHRAEWASGWQEGVCEQHHPVEKELHGWADPTPQSIKLVLHEQFHLRDAGPTAGEVLWVRGSRVGPCSFVLPVCFIYCNLLPYSVLDIEYEMTQFAFYYVGIGAAVFLLGYFQVILFLTATSDALEILTLVPQIGGIIYFLSNRSLCGWRLLPNRFRSSGKCTSGKWWGWRSAGSTAPLLASSTLVCQSECSNDDFAFGQRAKEWRNWWVC